MHQPSQNTWNCYCARCLRKGNVQQVWLLHHSPRTWVGVRNWAQLDQQRQNRSTGERNREKGVKMFERSHFWDFLEFPVTRSQEVRLVQTKGSEELRPYDFALSLLSNNFSAIVLGNLSMMYLYIWVFVNFAHIL